MQHIRTGEYSITACIFSLHLRTGALHLEGALEACLSSILGEATPNVVIRNAVLWLSSFWGTARSKRHTPAPLRSRVAVWPALAGRMWVEVTCLTSGWMPCSLPLLQGWPGCRWHMFCQPGSRSGTAQQASDRHAVRERVTLFLSHWFWSCWLLDHDLVCHDWCIKSVCPPAEGITQGL